MKYRADLCSHSIHCLQFHDIARTKYRQKILTTEITDTLKSINLDVAKSFDRGKWGNEDTSEQPVKIVNLTGESPVGVIARKHPNYI